MKIGLIVPKSVMYYFNGCLEFRQNTLIFLENFIFYVSEYSGEGGNVKRKCYKIFSGNTKCPGNSGIDQVVSFKTKYFFQHQQQLKNMKRVLIRIQPLSLFSVRPFCLFLIVEFLVYTYFLEGLCLRAVCKQSLLSGVALLIMRR